MAEQRRAANPGNFAEDRERAARAGHIGGQHSSGNFANDRGRAAEAGRKGGQASHGSTNQPQAGHKDEAGAKSARSSGAEHRPGNFAPGNFAEDGEKASAAGRKGGRAPH